MIFKTNEENQFLMFGKTIGDTLDNIKNKANEFNEIRLDSGLFGKDGAFASLFNKKNNSEN